MNRSGSGVLALAVLVAVFAGGGLRTTDNPTEQRTNHLSSGAIGGKNEIKQPATSKKMQSVTTAKGPEIDGFAEEATDVSSAIQNATTTSLTSAEKDKVDLSLKDNPASDTIGVMIAIVPDPVKTHLSLVFDRYLDAIEQAIQDNKFYFDRAQLPWDEHEHAESDNFLLREIESEYTEAKEEIPGVLIFRKHQEPKDSDEKNGKPDGEDCWTRHQDPSQKCAEPQYSQTHDVRILLVFVVGETPTAGVDRKQFATALQMAKHFSQAKESSRKPLNIIGPSFSGSLYSLAKLLQSETTVFSPITIASGGVGGREPVEEFRSMIGEIFQVPKSPAVVNFASFSENSQAMENALLQHACDQWRLWPKDVAVISETETAYGRQHVGALEVCVDHRLSPTDRTPVSLFFPRGIFHIRSAYEQQFPNGQPQADDRPQIRTNLRPNLEEQGNAGDSVPNFSKQGPVSQDAVLMGVVDELQKHNSQLLLVMASDPLDALFLVRYLRKNYAYGRLVLIGPDLLLRHEAEDPTMRGVMTVSDYSLRATEDGDIFHAGDRSAAGMIFPDDSSIATYNAATILVNCLLRPGMDWCKRGISGAASEVPVPWDIALADYGPSRFDSKDESRESSVCCRPEVHLDALGRGGFWPVASLKPPKESWMPRQQPNPATEVCEARPISRHMPDSWKLVGVALLAGFSWITIILYRASILSSFEAEVLLAPDRCRASEQSRSDVSSGNDHASEAPDISCGLTRATLIELLCLAWSLALVFVLWPLMTLNPASDRSGYWLLAAGIGVYIAQSYIVWRNFGIWKFHAGVILSVCCGFAFTSTPELASFVYQYQNIGSQISPLLPLLMVALSFAWWAWYGISGRVLTDQRRPRLPGIAQGLPPFLTAISAEEQQKLERVMAPGCTDSRIWAPLVTIAVFVVLLVPHMPLRSLEHYEYDYFLVVLLATSFCLMIASALRILAVWTDAKCLLRSIEGQSFRHTISRIGGFSWTSIWKIGAGSLSAAHALLTREFEALKLASSFPEVSALAGPTPEEGIFPESQIGKVWRTYVTLLSQRRGDPSTPPDNSVPTSRASDAADQEGALRHEDTECSLMFEFAVLQRKLARSAALLMSFLQQYDQDHPQVRCELDAKSLKKLREMPPATAHEASEYFVSMVYINYIITVLLRIRTLAAAAVGIFVFDVIAINAYPFEPRAILRTLLFGVFAALTACFGVVYAQMHRDPTLSRITDTKPGELGGDYWTRMLTVTLLPLLSLVATQFPAIGNFLYSWIEPAAKALR